MQLPSGDRFHPTPMQLVRAMLAAARLTAGESFIDLGSGDGRFVREAEARGAFAHGIDIDPELARKSGLPCGNLFDIVLCNYDVVAAGCAEPDTVTRIVARAKNEMGPGSRLIIRGEYSGADVLDLEGEPVSLWNW